MMKNIVYKMFKEQDGDYPYLFENERMDDDLVSEMSKVLTFHEEGEYEDYYRWSEEILCVILPQEGEINLNRIVEGAIIIYEAANRLGNVRIGEVNLKFC